MINVMDGSPQLYSRPGIFSQHRLLEPAPFVYLVPAFSIWSALSAYVCHSKYEDSSCSITCPSVWSLLLSQHSAVVVVVVPAQYFV